MASAAVTFSGFNNVDFNLVLNSLMQQASRPLTSLQNRQDALQSQITTYGTLSTRVLALQSAADDLSGLSGLSAFTALSSDTTAVAVSSAGATTPGQYDVVVNELARAQVTASASSAPDATSTVVANAGSLTIADVEVAIDGDVTLQGLADAINETEDISVHASVVRTSATTYRLVLTGNLTGEDNAFTVVNTLDGGLGVAFTDTDDNDISGDSPEDNAVAATDASITVNNIPVTGTSNTFEDVIPGVTLTAYRKDTAVVHIDVASDSSLVANKLQTFATAYNDVVKFVGDQRAAATRGDGGSIGRDPLLRQLGGSLRNALLSPHGDDTITRLSEIGVEFTQTGTLEINQTRLSEALSNNPDNVREVIGGGEGAFPSITDLLETYSQTSGFISSVKERLTTQIKVMDDQIERMQARLALQREALQREFIQADQAMSRLKNQSSALGSFGAGFGSL